VPITKNPHMSERYPEKFMHENEWSAIWKLRTL
jgi:hypothetical protein